MSQPLAGKKTSVRGSNLPSSQAALVAPSAAVSNLEGGPIAATPHPPARSTELDPGLGTISPIDNKPASPEGAAQIQAKGVNGELLAIDSLQSFPPEEREIVRQSDEAFVRVRQTWESWKQVRAGLVVLRDLAMREAGANDTKSKLYKNRFHELLEQRAYCSKKMEPSVRKTLLKCAELAPEIDDWHDRLDEHRRLRLDHPITVLHAFRKFRSCHRPLPNPLALNTSSNLRRYVRMPQLQSRAEMNGSMNCSNRSTYYQSPSTSPLLRQLTSMMLSNT